MAVSLHGLVIIIFWRLDVGWRHFVVHQSPTHHTPAHQQELNMAISQQSIQAFIAGSALTASLFYIYQSHARSHSSSKESTAAARGKNTNNCNANRSTPSRTDATAGLMDSSSLDQRMIRKAEGAIRNRTSRLIIVVERCTNDHNYVSCLH